MAKQGAPTEDERERQGESHPQVEEERRARKVAPPAQTEPSGPTAPAEKPQHQRDQ